jgi:hypothetical protein
MLNVESFPAPDKPLALANRHSQFTYSCQAEVRHSQFPFQPYVKEQRTSAFGPEPLDFSPPPILSAKILLCKKSAFIVSEKQEKRFAHFLASCMLALSRNERLGRFNSSYSHAIYV